MLLDVVREVRGAVAPSFTVSVELNSADFQHSGFDMDDADRIAMLEPLGVDLVELLGGSYESPATRLTSAPGPPGRCPRVRVRRIWWRTSAMLAAEARALSGQVTRRGCLSASRPSRQREGRSGWKRAPFPCR